MSKNGPRRRRKGMARQLLRRGARKTAEIGNAVILRTQDSPYHFVVSKREQAILGKVLLPGEQVYPSERLYPQEWKAEWEI